MSPSNVSYIEGDKAANLDVSQHPARFGSMVPGTPGSGSQGGGGSQGGTEPGGTTPSDKPTQPTDPTIPTGAVHITLSFATIADNTGWEDSKQYLTVPTGDANVTLVITDHTAVSPQYPSNSGKYYENGKNWRIYQNEKPTVTLSVGTSYKLVAFKFTYQVKNTGTWETTDGANIASGTTYGVTSGQQTSCTFTVGQSGTAKNGNVQISAIEIWYVAA